LLFLGVIILDVAMVVNVIFVCYPYTGANRVRSSSTAAIDHFEIHQGTHILQVSLHFSLL